MSTAATGHRAHDIRREDLATLACRAQSRGLDHGIAEIVVVLSGDLTAAQSDAKTDRPLTDTVVAFDALLHGDGARQRGRTDHVGEQHRHVLGRHRRAASRRPLLVNCGRGHASRQPLDPSEASWPLPRFPQVDCLLHA